MFRGDDDQGRVIEAVGFQVGDHLANRFIGKPNLTQKGGAGCSFRIEIAACGHVLFNQFSDPR